MGTTNTTTANTTTATAALPRKGQRIVVYGSRVSGGTLAKPGVWFATYCGSHRPSGTINVQGNTADRTFIARDRFRWEPRTDWEKRS